MGGGALLGAPMPPPPSPPPPLAEESFDVDAALARELAALGPAASARGGLGASASILRGSMSSYSLPPLQPAPRAKTGSRREHERHAAECASRDGCSTGGSGGDGSSSGEDGDGREEPECGGAFAALRDAMAQRERLLEGVERTLRDAQEAFGLQCCLGTSRPQGAGPPPTRGTCVRGDGGNRLGGPAAAGAKEEAEAEADGGTDTDQSLAEGAAPHSGSQALAAEGSCRERAHLLHRPLLHEQRARQRGRAPQALDQPAQLGLPAQASPAPDDGSGHRRLDSSTALDDTSMELGAAQAAVEAAPAPPTVAARATTTAPAVMPVLGKPLPVAGAAGRRTAAASAIEQLALQEAAATQRAAARQEALRVLEEKAAAAARRCLAASRIARAWRRFRASPAHAARTAAAARMQSAVRGWAARRRLGALRRARDALAAVQSELERGEGGAESAARLDRALEAAVGAGAGSQAHSAVSAFAAASEEAARALQQAATSDTHAAHVAAQEQAVRFIALRSLANRCAADFAARQGAAAAALFEAALASPARTVTAAAEAATVLGVSLSEVSTALAQARTRDAAAAATVAAAAAAAPFDPAALAAAAAVCERIGLGADVAAAMAIVERRRRVARKRLQQACAFGDLLPPAVPGAAARQAEEVVRGERGPAALEAIAGARDIGLESEACAAEARVSEAQAEALRRAEAEAERGCGPGTTAALARARSVGLSNEELGSALRRLQGHRDKATAALGAAAASGSYAAFARAWGQAVTVGCPPETLQAQADAFQSRRRAAASCTAAAARACCQELCRSCNGTAPEAVGAITATWCSALGALQSDLQCEVGESDAGPQQQAPSSTAAQLPPSCGGDESLRQLATAVAECRQLRTAASARHALRAVGLQAGWLEQEARSMVARGTLLVEPWGVPEHAPAWVGVEAGQGAGHWCRDGSVGSGGGQQSAAAPGAWSALHLAHLVGVAAEPGGCVSMAQQWRTQQVAIEKLAAPVLGHFAPLAAAGPPAPRVQQLACVGDGGSGGGDGGGVNAALAAKVCANLGGAAEPSLATELDLSLEQVDCVQGLDRHCPQLQVGCHWQLCRPAACSHQL
jgi:hypothetical protein